jgi:nucleotide-binding universal stress UspA family protein
MYQTMLVPLDGSPQAEIVLPYVKRFCAKFGSRAVFVNVCPVAGLAAHMCETYMKHIAELAQADLKGARVEVVAVADPGNAASRILQEADRRKADLIMMASHGQSGRGQWELGSVVHKALNASKVPILVIKEELPPDFGDWPATAMVPLDGSPLSESVLPHVIRIGKAGTRITLFRVCEPPVLLSDYVDSTMPEQWEEHTRLAMRGAERACAVYLENVGKDRIETEGLRAQAEVLLADRAPAGIIEYAGRDQNALVVMSTHGHSGFSRFPYGHVADRVLLACKNPLLLVRPGKSR